MWNTAGNNCKCHYMALLSMDRWYADVLSSVRKHKRIRVQMDGQLRVFTLCNWNVLALYCGNEVCGLHHISLSSLVSNTRELIDSIATNYTIRHTDKWFNSILGNFPWLTYMRVRLSMIAQPSVPLVTAFGYNHASCTSGCVMQRIQ